MIEVLPLASVHRPIQPATDGTCDVATRAEPKECDVTQTPTTMADPPLDKPGGGSETHEGSTS